MTDFIKTSRKIHEWLTAQAITFEVDEFAPVVNEGGICFAIQFPHKDYDCPFFGPGGADNCLKALRELEDKTAGVFSALNWEGKGIEASWTDCMYPHIRGHGKTDGIALHDLLYKLMEEKKCS